MRRWRPSSANAQGSRASVAGARSASTRRKQPRSRIPSLRWEREAWRAGAGTVAGVDEVGVGPLAGPVTAAAVLLAPGDKRPWFRRVRDSKMLTAAAREELAEVIEDSIPFAIGWATSQEVDSRGIVEARRLSVLRAIEGLPTEPDGVISDALPLPLENVRVEPKADARSVSVAAASIVAKVARDRWMTELCERIPGYGFCRNKGYYTVEHRAAIDRRGPCEAHRLSWAPFAQGRLEL